MYQSLYRKYRPKTFNEIYGQEIAKKILINSLDNKKMSHAYLFFGPRGTGKTSIAKMFARACNCENVKNGNCCEKCDNCLESIDKNCVDIIEIDAASNNGVDEIRELKNKINLVPNKLKFKVYIIDEVHMLSTGAFNALLKTLEEPPSHVIFILATTEYYKVPATIVSRCQTIEFKNIDDQNIINRLKKISTEEKIKVNDEALAEIAKNSNGGLRDAIGLLDKAVSSADEKRNITTDDIKEMVGTVTQKEIEILFKSIINGNIKECLAIIDNYSIIGKNLIKILSDLIDYSLNQAFINYDENLIKLIKVMDDYQTRMKNSISVKVLFKMLMIELNTQTNVRINEVDSIDLKQSEEANNNNKNNDNDIKIRINNSFVNADKKILLDLKNKWKELEKLTFDTTVGAIACDLLDCTPVVSSKSNLIICVNYSSLEEKINGNLELYDRIMKEKIGIDQQIVAVEQKKWDSLKKEYLNNLKNNIKYVYIEPNTGEIYKLEKKSKKSSTEQKAKELFGDLLN